LDFSNFNGKDFIEVIYAIQNKYYKKYSSPAPYICLFKVDALNLLALKIKLWDKDIIFCDGTHFNGDKFRIEDLIKETHDQDCGATFKIFTDQEITSLMKKKSFGKVFIFTDKTDSQFLNFGKSNIFYLKKVGDILNLL
jgi:hypothetical protein